MIWVVIGEFIYRYPLFHMMESELRIGKKPQTPLSAIRAKALHLDLSNDPVKSPRKYEKIVEDRFVD
jgi:hypothetical protein